MGLRVWPFTLKRNATTSEVIHAPFERVQSILRDAPNLITLNPLVVGYELQSGTDDTYIITDKLRMLGIPFTSKYTAKVIKTDDSTTFEVRAGGGVQSTNTWKWKAKGVDEIEVSEEAVIEAPFVTILFVVNTIKRTHKVLLQELKRKVEGKETETPLVEGEVTIQKSKRELYDMSHLDLNKDREGPNEIPKTEWLNMGLWRRDGETVSSFPEACTRLCDEVIRAARVSAGDRVLDVGHACGDSLLRIISQPPSSLPMSVTGVTTLPIHHERAKKRVDETLQAIPKSLRPKVTLYLGDVIYRSNSPPNHPFRATAAIGHPPFDRILALDCAYHFETRKIFFEQAFASLIPGGRIALADICLPAHARSLLRRALDSSGAFMPRENMWTVNEYEAKLRLAGYEDVFVKDITDDVFPGFQSFLRTRGWRWWITEQVIATYVEDGARFVLASARKP